MRNRFLTKLLFLAVILVWGTVGYRLFATLASTGDNEATGPVADLPSPDTLGLYRYRADTRDPFVVRDSPARGPRLKKTSPKEIWTPPPLKLSGIVARRKSFMALVEGSDGSVSFMKRGDTLQGLKVLQVVQDSVTYFYRKKKGGWKFDRP